jgi:soluble lytic murein transglycosylase
MIKKSIKFLLTAVLICVILSVGCYYAVSRLFPVKYYDIIKEYSNEYNLDPALVCAVINAESHFREDVESHKGASGLMQLMEPTADWIAAKTEIENYTYDEVKSPEMNIRLGCALLGELYKIYDDESSVIAAYNAGTGNVDKWLTDPMYSGDGIHLMVIPFKETSDYVKKVEKYRKIYDLILKNYA